MFELIMIVALIVFMYRLAEHENMAGWLWGLITFAVCGGAMFIPLPYVRVVIAGAVAFGAMFAFKLLGD